ncbi:GAF domain-containing protein [Gleimia hominis]|uniref:GAF domain-containing protein n=1 Tax=Gleimia hominis TaxID=595468 RepID=A0ABU3ICN4_9ACTO|nr:GAF domain-containing protein [Gleimia hominis]MDT3768129.1 GAF domain-containing protein [Gleimia hominis]
MTSPDSQPTLPHAEKLVDAMIKLTAASGVDGILQAFVNEATRLTNARYGALSILDTWGEARLFFNRDYTHPSETEQVFTGMNLVNLVPTDETYILNDASSLDRIPQSDAETLHKLLVTPTPIHDQTMSRLYLVNKPTDFDDDDVRMLHALTRVAAATVAKARLYQESRNRERWMKGTQRIVTSMLEGNDEEEILPHIAKTVLDVAQADTALIVLPSVGYSWACEISEGYMADTLLGTVFPPEGRAMAVVHEGTGMIVDSLANASMLRVDQLKNFGPAMYVPLINRGVAQGVLLILRKIGAPAFNRSDLPLAEALAGQAAFALELSSARHTEDMAALYDERDRIGRDLHDFAIQQLFATGMRIDTAKAKLYTGDTTREQIDSILSDALEAVDASVRQIRSIVHDLREPDQEVDLVERLRRETSIARNSLGFAPSLILDLDGQLIEPDDPDSIDEVSARVDDAIADDVVAVVREGLSNIARHAHATAAQVLIDVHGHAELGEISVRVTDDGVGIPKNRTRTSGLGNLRMRARRLKGSFKIGPAQTGHGTTMVWTVPLADY